jgi:hypothetical protein
VADSPSGLNDLYVAITRATQRLGVVHEGDIPESLTRLKPRPTSPETSQPTPEPQPH